MKETSVRQKSNHNDHEYFEGLETLLSNNAQILQNLYKISKITSQYRAEKSRLQNIVQNLSMDKKEKMLSHNLIIKTINFKKRLDADDFNLKEDITNNPIDLSIDFMGIYKTVFKDAPMFQTKLDDFIYQKIDSSQFDEFEAIQIEIKELVYENGEYYKYPGFSVAQMERLQKLLEKIGFMNNSESVIAKTKVSSSTVM